MLLIKTCYMFAIILLNSSLKNRRSYLSETSQMTKVKTRDILDKKRKIIYVKRHVLFTKIAAYPSESKDYIINYIRYENF